MRRFALIAALVATLPGAVAAPALAQTAAEQRRWDDAQARYDRELQIYQQERDRYYAARDRSDRYTPPPRGRYDNAYDPSRDYRETTRVSERRMSSNDQVYEGSDGRYYCKRSDGTTGLIVGAAAGGILGNVVDGGRKRTAGTLIGGALGALAGKSIDQNSDIRCR